MQRSKHSGVLGLFRERYVKAGRIEAEYSDIYGQAFDTRVESDYDVQEWPTRETAAQMLTRAEQFVARIKDEIEEPS